MAFAIISDIHGNLEALQTVLSYLQEKKIEQIFCLGDVVGYGPNPNECVALVRENCSTVLMGNHDYAAIGKANLDYFNEFARIATYWTREILTEENRQYLESLPLTHQTDQYLMVHASPTNPEHWYYVLSVEDARIEMQSFTQSLCFIGHSHVPVIYSKETQSRAAHFEFEQNQKYIVNVGSVGQPRDRDPRACVTLVDLQREQLDYVRLEYDVQNTQKKIIDAGLPKFLAERILIGY